jgi:Kdo2-lipid IVA lauroyltransferase/acyltransferase
LSLLSRPLKKLRRSFYPLAIKPAETWVRHLSEENREMWAKHLGSLAYRALAAARERALHHLHLAFGASLTPQELQAIALKCFQNLILNFLECAHFEQSKIGELLEKIEVEGWEHVEEAYGRGKGAILVGGHLGNWEMAAVCFAIRGYPIQVVARRIYIEALNRTLIEMRERLGVKTLYRDGSMRSMIRCLQNNQFLAILPDQDVRRIQGIFVDFFGHPAYTPTGPALLAIGSGSPLIVVRNIRKDGHHLLTVDPPVYADRKAPRDEEVRRLVTRYTKRLEDFIREYPTQWVWTHRRWRTRPESLQNPRKDLRTSERMARPDHASDGAEENRVD